MDRTERGHETFFSQQEFASGFGPVCYLGTLRGQSERNWAQSRRAAV